MMRVAIDCRSIHSNMGGIGYHTRDLVKALSQVDAENEYHLFFGQGKPESRITHTANFHETTFETAMLDERWEQIELPTELKEREIDLYHSPCFSTPCVRTCKAYVATVHDVVFRQCPDLVEPGLRAYLDRWAEFSCKASQTVITVSEYSKSEICQAYGTPKSRVTVVYNGLGEQYQPIDDADRLKMVRMKHNLPEKFILNVGSIEPKKNPVRLLEAFRQFKRHGPEHRHKLVLVGGQGSGDFKIEDEIRKLQMDEEVIVAGYLPDEDLVAVYNLADAFVYPSLYEGFGLPPLEAMACGTPTLVSDRTSLPEVVGDAALVVDAESVDLMAEGIEKLVTDEPLRERLQMDGIERAKGFTWEKAAKETLSVYEKALSRN